MTSSHHLVAGFNATDEAADGLVLADVLCRRLDHGLVVARVFTGGEPPEVTDRTVQRRIRDQLADTRRALLAAVPDAAALELVPVVDTSVARGLHELAETEGAEAIVVGSSHHHGLGRLLLGGSPELVADGAPCPVFVAPPGFRTRGALAPDVVGVGYDGSPTAEAALRHACALALRLGTPLRVVAVQSRWHGRTAGARHDVGPLLEQARGIAEGVTEGRVALELVRRDGDPAAELVAQTHDGVGLLVLGSGRHGTLRRVLLGSVAAAVLRSAAAPVAIATG